MRSLLPKILDGCLVVVLAFMVFSCFIISMAGCKTCTPEIKVVEVKVPVRVCETPPEIPALSLPQWPAFPEVVTEDTLKEFYADCVMVLRQREAIMQKRIELLNSILSKYGE
jgi:hypothetical protein